MSLFKDRRHAGQVLASKLEKRGGADSIVLALPRDGVPVAYEIACALGAPLDVFVMRNLGAPGHAEPTIGTLASGGLVVLDDHVVSEHDISAEEVSDVER